MDGRSWKIRTNRYRGSKNEAVLGGTNEAEYRVNQRGCLGLNDVYTDEEISYWLISNQYIKLNTCTRTWAANWERAIQSYRYYFINERGSFSNLKILSSFIRIAIT